MAYFVFLNNLDNVTGSLYRIAENQSDLDNLIIDKSLYKIIEDSQDNFNSVKYGTKIATKYNGNQISYENRSYLFSIKSDLESYVNNYKQEIKSFTNNNPSHPLLNRWNSYYDQLNSLNLSNINIPLTMSLEQYFNSLGQTSFNPLQLP